MPDKNVEQSVKLATYGTSCQCARCMSADPGFDEEMQAIQSLTGAEAEQQMTNGPEPYDPQSW
jgi:hypothetical protein